jgi:hypothetical protein
VSLLFPFPLSWPSVLSDVSVSRGIRKQFSRGLGFCFVGGGELEGFVFLGTFVRWNERTSKVQVDVAGCKWHQSELQQVL